MEQEENHIKEGYYPYITGWEENGDFKVTWIKLPDEGELIFGIKKED